MALTGWVRHSGVRGFPWAARRCWRCPAVVEALKNLLQAGGVGLGLGDWILGLLWYKEECGCSVVTDSWPIILQFMVDKIPPFLLWSQVASLLHHAPSAVLLLLQHSCRAKAINQTHTKRVYDRISDVLLFRKKAGRGWQYNSGKNPKLHNCEELFLLKTYCSIRGKR